MKAHSAEGQSVYRIVVRGRLDEGWSDWLGGMSVAVEQADDATPITVLTGQVADQPALRGIINRLWDLNLILVSVNPIFKGSSFEEANR